MARTVVIGGGTSGLAAAYALQKAGSECVVLEAQHSAGGRIAGAKKEGFILDLGAQFFFSRYRETFTLMEELGIAHAITRFTKPIGILRKGKVHFVDPRMILKVRSPREILAINPLSPSGTIRAARLIFGLFLRRRLFDFDDATKALALDHVSLADFARRNFGDEVLEYALQPVASALTLGEPEEISAAYGLALLWYGIPGLFTTSEGIGLLAEVLNGNVKDVVTGARAQRIVIENHRVKAVELRKGRKKETIDCENAICATPASEAARLLKGVHPSITRALSRVGYSACVHVMFALEEKLMGEAYAIATPRHEGLCFAGLTENANKAESYAPDGKGILHAYTFGSIAKNMLGATQKEILERVEADVEKLLPGLKEKKMFHEIFKWEKAVCLSPPGHIASMARIKESLGEIAGLYLAGEYLGMPSVEAAIHTGKEAARKVIESS